MIIIASFFSAGFEPTQFDLAMEINKNIFNVIDCLGIFVALKNRWSTAQMNSENPNVRIWAFAIGWSLCDAICSNLFYLIFNATADEFSWKYILRAFSSNLDIVEIFCTVALIVALTRNLKRGEKLFDFSNAVVLIILFSRATLFPIYASYLHFSHPNSELNIEQIAAKGVFTVGLWAVTGLGKYF